jgi:hypothetical protein
LNDTDIFALSGQRNPPAAKRGHRKSTHHDYAGDPNQLHLYPQLLRRRIVYQSLALEYDHRILQTGHQVRPLPYEAIELDR